MKKLIPARSVATAICAGTAVVALALSASPAFATASKAGTVEETLAIIAPETLDNLAQPTVTDEAAEHIANDAVATVPLDASEGIRIASADSDLKIGLPFAEEAAPLETDTDAIIAFDNGNESSTAAVVHDDGSVQITTIIESAAAPKRFDYPVAVPEGGALTLESNGFVAITNAAGDLVGGAAPAWARGADGKAVSTHYEVDGATLTQVVDHAETSAYPVVADPWLGITLISSAKWTTRDKRGKTLVVVPTAWGRATTNTAGAITAGWNEVKQKAPSANTTQMYWQYACHQQFAPLKASWNLDTWVRRTSYADSIKNLCN